MMILTQEPKQEGSKTVIIDKFETKKIEEALENLQLIELIRSVDYTTISQSVLRRTRRLASAEGGYK